MRRRVPYPPSKSIEKVDKKENKQESGDGHLFYLGTMVPILAFDTIMISACAIGSSEE